MRFEHMHQIVDFENDCPSDCVNCPSRLHCDSQHDLPICPRCGSALVIEVTNELMNEITGQITEELIDYKHCMECDENFM